MGLGPKHARPLPIMKLREVSSVHTLYPSKVFIPFQYDIQNG